MSVWIIRHLPSDQGVIQQYNIVPLYIHTLHWSQWLLLSKILNNCSFIIILWEFLICQNMATGHGQISELGFHPEKNFLKGQGGEVWNIEIRMKTYLENELESLPDECQNESLHWIWPEKNPGTWFQSVPGNQLQKIFNCGLRLEKISTIVDVFSKYLPVRPKCPFFF